MHTSWCVVVETRSTPVHMSKVQQKTHQAKQMQNDSDWDNSLDNMLPRVHEWLMHEK